MANAHGSFIWYELLTSDPDAAIGFYAGLLGWQDSPHEGQAGYRILSHGAEAIGGLMRAPAGVPPCWLGYIGVDDVDAAVAAILADGGQVRMPARDLPGVGRIAMVADPHGAPFYVMRGAGDRASTSFAPDRMGHCGWNELGAGALDAAVEFYARHFGWSRGQLLPMGEMGGYQLIEHQGRAIGAIMQQPGGAPPMWRFYFHVPAIDAAAQRVKDSGGAILHGPVEVPGGDQILIGTDPQGAVFALVGKPGAA
ncbi:VOC family protein [Falsiroseomonas sp. E2-1-a4]|uniref:VOC family protein n=1 Tax=Falsiroseomonas sp. E2-1-a4 TaxID=3239299 RepID=UPI003F2A6A6F